MRKLCLNQGHRGSLMDVIFYTTIIKEKNHEYLIKS